MNKFQYRLEKFSNKKSSKKEVSKASKNNLEIENITQGSESLDFNIKQEVLTRNIMSVCIDEGVKEASYYRYVSQAINELTEDDTLQFFINSPGGTFSGLSTLLSSMDYSGCNTVAVIQGDCSSAASMLALSCHEVQVSPLASMLVHFVSYGSVGAASHIKAHVDHTQKVTESVFRNIYEGFLTEEEIVSCIEQDRQIWLDSEQIIQRLENRLEYVKSKAEDTENTEDVEDAYDLYNKNTLSDAQEGPTIDLNEGTGTTLLPSTSEGSKSVVEGSVKTPVKNPTKKTTKK